MTSHLGKARPTARVTSLAARIQLIQKNLRSKVPHGAQLAHLWSLWGDESACDGCGQVIAVDEIEYELQFGNKVDAICIKLHQDCWENWRARKLESDDPQRRPASSPRQWYLCTRHADGRTFCGEQADLHSAINAVTTFLNTARHMGYRIHPRHTLVEPRTRYVARQGAAWVMFWVGDVDESTTVESRRGSPAATVQGAVSP